VEDLSGKQFGSYQIVAPLGEGGMAAVYKASQPAMERFVALKVLPRHMSASDEFVARFRREARLLAQLQHPHILPVFDYGESEGYPYIVMPFIVSGTLADILRDQRLSLSEVRRIISQIGDALSYAHAHGMIHRDIKPSNILIDERGNCLLTDFGLARMAEAADKLTTSGAVMGTPAYMSPEQGTGSATDQRSDIYSLGIILYEMLTGRVPYTAETPIAVVFKHVQDPLPSARKFNPSLPEGLELVLLKSLAKNPEDRYQTADAFVQAVQQVISENPSADETLSAKIMPVLPAAEEETRVAENQSRLESASEKPMSRRFPVLALTGMGAIGLAIIVAVMMMSRSNTSRTETVTLTIASTTVSTDIPALVSSPTMVSTTSTPQNAAMPGNTFRDEFDHQLGEGWTWLAEDPSKWSLSAVPGLLQIIASDASLDGPSLPPNILLRDAPAGDFEVTTSIKFTPTSNFQFAGLVVFQDHGNALQFGRAFCDLANACLGDGIYFDNFENGSIRGSSSKTTIDGPVVYLRLKRVGTTYTGYYSKDGEKWTMLGEHIKDLSQVRVGLMADQAPQAISAQFDSFTLVSQNE
jgi:serine/threonine protein kinase